MSELVPKVPKVRKVPKPVEVIQNENVITALIDLVQPHPELWDMSCTLYRELKRKDKLPKWAAIAQELNITTIKAKNTFSNLRTVLKRELKKVKKVSSGAEGPEGEDGEFYDGTWPHWKKLQFLRDVVAPRATSGNLDSADTTQSHPAVTPAGPSSSSPSIELTEPNLESHPSNSQLYDEFFEDLAIDDEEEDDFRQRGSAAVDNRSGSGSGSQGNGLKRPRQTSMQQALHLEAKKIKVFEEREHNRRVERESAKKNEMDPDINFARSLIPYLKALKKGDKLKVKIQFLTVLSEYFDDNDMDDLNI